MSFKFIPPYLTTIISSLIFFASSVHSEQTRKIPPQVKTVKSLSDKSGKVNEEIDDVNSINAPAASKKEIKKFIEKVVLDKKRLIINEKIMLESLLEKGEQLKLIKNNFDEYEKDINKKLTELLLSNENAEIKFCALQSSMGMVNYTPYGYSLFYGELIHLSDSFSEIVASGEYLSKLIDDNVRNFNDMSKSLERLSRKDLSPKLADAVAANRQLLMELQAKAEHNQKMFSYYSLPVKRLEKRIKESIVKIKLSYNQRLPTFFLEPYYSVFSIDFWNISMIRNEISSLPSYARSAFYEQTPSTKRNLVKLLALMIFLWIPFVVLVGRYALRLINSLRIESKVTSRSFLIRACVSSFISIFFFISLLIVPFPNSVSLQMSALFFLAFSGIQIIRAIENYGKSSPFPSPMSAFLLLFLIAFVLQIINCPLRLFSIIWILSLSLGIVYCYVNFKEFYKGDGSAKFLLLLFIPMGAFIFGTALTGFFYLSHLLYKITFLALTAFHLAFSLKGPLRKHAENQLKQRILYATTLNCLGIPLIWLVVSLFVLFYISNQFGASASNWIYSFTIQWQNIKIGSPAIIAIILLFFFCRTINKAFHAFISVNYTNTPQKALLPSVKHFVTYSLWILFFLVSFQIVGVNLTSISLIIGGVSMGIGFGLRDMVTNLIGGVILIFNKELRPSDIIYIDDGTWAQVQSVNFRSTVVRTYDNAVVSIPNSKILASKLTNWSLGSPEVRMQINFSFSHTTDMEKLQSVLLETALLNKHVLAEPAPSILIKDFNQENIELLMHVWFDSVNNIDDVNSKVAALSDLKSQLIRALFKDDVWTLPEEPQPEQQDA